jgi:hypothetical protein
MWRRKNSSNSIKLRLAKEMLALHGYDSPLQSHHMSLMAFVVSPPGCGRSVIDFSGWDAHQAQLRCFDEVDGDI